jgi:hypothetical protein
MSDAARGWIRKHRNILAAVGIVVALVLIWWWWAVRPYSTAALPISECRQLYLRARSAAETTVVDAVRPAQQPRGRAELVTCGTLRREGSVP